MNTLQIWLIVILFLMLGLCLFVCLKQLAEKCLKRKILFKSILKDWGKKMAMVAGIGPVFFGLYVFLVYLGTLVQAETRMHAFFLLYQYPVEAIYGGLFIFACVSVGIYCVRLVVKFICNSR